MPASASLHESEHDPRSDLDLIAAVNGCDAEAFAVLYRRYRDWVVQLAYRFSGDRELALDVLQETFTYFFKKFPGFALTCQLKTFLYPVVRNLSVAARRKAQRWQAADDMIEELPAPPSLQDLAEASRDEMTAALLGLSAEHREVLLLRFVDGLSLKEVADALEIPLGTVKSRVHNALETLRRDERTKKFFQE